MKIVCSILFLFALSVKAIQLIESLDYSSESDMNSECEFEESMCNWGNDPNNWPVNWRLNAMSSKEELLKNGEISTVERNSVCLSLHGKSNNHQSDYDITARLFSPIISIMKQPSCIQLIYNIQYVSGSLRDHISLSGRELNMYGVDDRIPKLSLLRRQMGACDRVTYRGDPAVVCANKPIWSSMKSNSLQDLNQSIWNIVFIQLDQQITNQSESTLSDYKLILEGTIPAGYPDARICVDNITSYTEPCSALEKASAPLPSQWSWAQYFGLTFVGALILGLLIPVLFLVILIWACRRRHHAMHSNYTNSKLFSTNLWYYIGGKEICDDPNGFRGSSSLLRSKQFNSPSATGTLLNGGGGHHLMLSNADVMDLPDVVVPGGRVVAFNYSGNTLGGNTLRHNHNNAGYTNTNYLSNAQNGQVMLTNVNGTVSLNNCGTNVTTVARTGQNAMPLVSNELIQQQSQSQQQNETYNYQTNPVFGESASMALMTASQSPMLMTQSMAPNYGSEANHIAQSNFSNANTQQINQLNSNGQVYNKPAVPPAQQQHQPRAQSQYFPRPNNLKRI
ncbi:unnamed protein product [Schistosoma mattheei]|uniref:MAM domain-containing protein n=1 Tax=Schistosoma mattheei TaxID=31246 RepID=A0AA85BCX6_9TREM|nr:unnamed protein product [Schistosoma mattheei]